MMAPLLPATRWTPDMRKEWLLWMAGRLIDAGISFSFDLLPDGTQWTVGVDNEVASNKVSALIRLWNKEHEARS